jgi:hypothetical protein
MRPALCEKESAPGAGGRPYGPSSYKVKYSSMPAARTDPGSNLEKEPNSEPSEAKCGSANRSLRLETGAWNGSGRTIRGEALPPDGVGAGSPNDGSSAAFFA